MKEFLDTNFIRIMGTILVLILCPIVRYLLYRLVKSYSEFVSISKTRAALTKKSINFILLLAVIIVIITLWGVKPQNIFLTLSSIFAVIGVALFAQWSILSNFTAGFVLFFSLHLKIGDTIKILDKDFPVIAEVEDIKSFHVYLRGEDCQRYVYPNNLLLQKGISILESKKRVSETDHKKENNLA